MASPFDWLDTETKSLLARFPPQKQVGAETDAYSLLLLQWGQDRNRIEHVVAAIRRTAETTNAELPFVIAQRMTLNEALAGQIALVCCDCISAFVPDHVVSKDNRKGLKQLLHDVSASSEFEPVRICLTSVPDTEAGRRFCWQFLGMAVGTKVPDALKVFRIKARLMQHWAMKSDVGLQVENG